MTRLFLGRDGAIGAVEKNASYTRRRPVKRVCFVLSVAMVMAFASSASADLVAYWDFEEGAGTTTKDQINNTDEPLTGTTWVTNPADLPPVPGGTTAAMLFESANSAYIDTAFDGIGGSAARTIALWVKLTDITDSSASQGLVSYGGRESNGRKWHVRINSDGPPRIRGTIRTEAQGGNQSGTTNLADGQWHHVASVFPGGAGSDNVDVLHYVDGVLEGELGATDEPINTSIGGTLPAVTLGARRQAGNITRTDLPIEFFNGMMDDVRFYDHALSEAEIQSLAVVPEPGSIALVITALFGLAGLAWRRRVR